MIRRGRLFVLVGAVGMTFQAIAVDAGRAVSPRRQLAACMNKQMSASRTISYNQATAVCKGQLKPKAPALASSLQPKQGGGLAK
jgi:hypothetical protein